MATTPPAQQAVGPNLAVPDPPTLHQRYSGIPQRLLGKARKVKEAVYLNQTQAASEDRVQLPVIPKGITEPLFNKAIEELRGQLGRDNVVLNDQPLVDGWSVCHRRFNTVN